MNDIKEIINKAWENKDNINQNSEQDIKDAINQIIADLDSGKKRVAEKIGNAVKRNKIKRRLRNIASDAIKKISIKCNYSYLVIAKATMLNNEYKNIKEIIFQDFKNIK